MKNCCRCGNSLPASAEFFSRSKISKDGLTSQCKGCRRAMWKEQYEKNREYHIERAIKSNKQNRARPDFRDKERKYSRDRKRLVLADPVAREAHRERTKAWFAANRDRVKAMPSRSPAMLAHKSALYLARQKQATPPWADLKLIAQIYEQARRMTIETGIKHEVDHIVPLNHKRVCGLHSHTNLRVIPADENRAKSNHFLIV